MRPIPASSVAGATCWKRHIASANCRTQLALKGRNSDSREQVQELVRILGESHANDMQPDSDAGACGQTSEAGAYARNGRHYVNSSGHVVQSCGRVPEARQGGLRLLRMQDVRHNLVVTGLLDNQFPGIAGDIVHLLSNKSDDTVHITQNHTTAIIATLDATCW